MGLKRTQLEERYELRRILGEGGMGVVYAAFDRLMQREVALKTILDIDTESTAMFYNEWNLLANMVHPNVISIYDIGEFENEGTKKPFFVMPLLPGVTLDRLIRDGSPRLSVSGVLNIIEQACRGLHAAHMQGLIHRDVKPSNIFVMEDDSVKVIDFGLARTASSTDTGALRGTYPYMAPEQFARKPPSPLSDLFALGVVTYQALTRRRPFQGTEDEAIEAIQRTNPPPVSALNRDVNYPISMVVAKALAKQPRHRFLNMLEFAAALQKAARNEPLEWFDRAKVKARLDRAAQSFEQGDYNFAAEVLSELEGEGHLDAEIAILRGQVDGAVRRNRVRTLLESARRFFEASEYPLALLKIQEALELDPDDPDTKILQEQVEKKRRESKLSEWLALARAHLDNLAFRQAREALDHLLQLKPNDAAALALLAEVERQEQELARLREEKTRTYQSAREAWDRGDVTAALSRLEVLINLDRDNPDSDTSRSATYQDFFNLVRSEHNAIKNSYEEARRKLEADAFPAALAVSRQVLSKYPNHALFQALLFDIENRQRQKLSSAIAETDRRVQAECDLDRRVAILTDALKLYPNEPHFEGALRSVRDKRDLVNSIVAKARFFEERAQFNEAIDQWQILKSIHAEHPELGIELPRLIKRRDQQARDNSRARLLEQITKYLDDGDYDRAMLTVQNALVEFPEDPEFLGLQLVAGQNQERGRKALQLLAAAQETADSGAYEQSIAQLREAQRTDPRSTVIRRVLVNSLLDRGRRVVDADRHAAEELLHEVLEIEPNCPAAAGLASRIAERKPDATPPVQSPPSEETATEPRLRSLPTIAVTETPSVPEAAAAPPPLPSVPPAVQIAPPPKAPSASTIGPSKSAKNSDSVTADATTPVAVGKPAEVKTTPVEIPAAEPVPPPAPLTSNPRAKHRLPPLSAADINKLRYGLVGAAAVLIVLSGINLATRGTRPKPRPTPTQFRVSLLASRLGAQIRVNGNPCGVSNCDLDLDPGTYRAEAQLPGFLPAATIFTVTAEKGGPGAIELTLAPAPPLIILSSDLTFGSVFVDGTPIASVQDGGAEVPAMVAGTHEISIQSGELQASFTLEAIDGALPRITSPIQAKGVRIFVVSESGTQAVWYGSETNLKIALDGQPLGDMVKEGLEIRDVAAGAHELTFVGPGVLQEKMVFEIKTSPAMYIRLVRRVKSVAPPA